MVAPAPEMQYEIAATCDPEQGTATASGMTTFTEGQIYHLSGEEIMFEMLNFNLTATPAEGYQFLGWVDIANMVKADDDNLNTPQKVIAMMQAIWPELQAADPRNSVYEQLLKANASFDAETFYDYLFLYEPEDGHITFTAIFAEEQEDPQEGIEEINASAILGGSQSVMVDGTLYILRPDGKVYNAQGQAVK